MSRHPVRSDGVEMNIEDVQDQQTRREPRWRRILAVVLVVLASLILLVAVIGVWAKRTVLDTNRFGGIVSDVVAEPEVTDAVAVRVADEVTTLLQDGGQIQQLLPDQLQRIEPVIIGALSGFVEEQTAKLLATDEVQNLLVGAAETAHRAALRILEGDGLLDGGGLTVEDGTVTLNLVPIVQRVLLLLQDRGVIPADVELPAVGAEVTVPEQVQRIGTALGVELDDDFGQITVYESDRLSDAQATVAEAQRALAIFQRGVVLLVIVALVLIALALIVSPNRWRTLAQLGIGAALVMVLAFVIVNRVVENVPASIEAPGAQAATATLLESATAGLRRGLALIGLLGVAAAIVGYVFGRSDSARRLRAGTTDVAVAGATGVSGWTQRLVNSHPDGARVAVLAIAALVLLVWGLSWPSLLVAAVIGIGGLMAIAALTPAAPQPPRPAPA
jgi:hypothetical protein